VLDFGLAAEIRSSMSRVSQEQGDSSGTRPYMAPEQWVGKRQGPYTDQYSLAVLFYELVSGAVPFQSVFETGDMQLMRDVVKTELVEPLEELDAKQNAVLLRALSKDPNERFGNCLQLIDEISGMGESPGPAPSVAEHEEVSPASVKCPVCNYKGAFVPLSVKAVRFLLNLLFCVLCVCFLHLSNYYYIYNKVYFYLSISISLLFLFLFVCSMFFTRYSVWSLKCPQCKNIAFRKPFFKSLLIVQGSEGFRKDCSGCSSTKGFKGYYSPLLKFKLVCPVCRNTFTTKCKRYVPGAFFKASKKAV
jgi:hypothetical protein